MDRNMHIPYNTLPETNIAARPSQRELVFQPSIFEVLCYFQGGRQHPKTGVPEPCRSCQSPSSGLPNLFFKFQVIGHLPMIPWDPTGCTSDITLWVTSGLLVQFLLRVAFPKVKLSQASSKCQSQ